MNPDAKEFVPAHILKRRQEEAQRLGDLTEQLNKVEIGSTQGKETDKSIENGEGSNSISKATGEDLRQTGSKDVQENQASKQAEDNNSKPENQNDEKSTSNTNNNLGNSHPTHEDQNGQHQYKNNNNHNEGEYPEGLQDLIDEEDDRFLLNAGENLCEFNGEQFIIPGE